MFTQLTGTDIVHIPYKGSAPAVTDLLAGQTNMMFDNIPSSLPHIKSGKLIALATSGAKRDPALPNLPTIAEAGVPGYESGVWFGLMVPAATPKEVIAKLNAAAVQATPSPLISDYERADRFLNVDLGPSLVETNQALPGVTSKCTSSLPPPCKDALIVLNKAMIDVDSAIQNSQRDIPVCIGRPVQQFKDDWTGMEQGVSQAISGFNESNRTLIIEGLQHFVAIAKYMKPDVDRINKAQQTCAKTV